MRLLESNPTPNSRIQPLDGKDVRCLSGNHNCVYITTSDANVLRNEDGYCKKAWQNCPELESNKISYIASGSTFHVGLSQYGKIFSWIDMKDEQNDGSISMSLPRMLNLSSKVIQVSCGMNHTVFLTQERRIGIWGSNSDGQLGLGNEAAEQYSKPQIIDCLAGIPFFQVTAGGYHTCALTVFGAVFGWGKNSSGQLGFKKPEIQPNPERCCELQDEIITHISCGENHTAMLSMDGRVFSFGLDIDNHPDEAFQQVADGEIHALKEMKVSAVACGIQNTIAFVSDNSQNQIFVYGLGQREIQLDKTEGGVDLFTANGLTFVHSSQMQDQKNDSRVFNRMLSLDQMQKEFPTEISKKYLKQKLKPFLSTASIWNGSFLLCHQKISLSNHGVNMDAVKIFFDFLKEQNNQVSKTVIEALKDLIKVLPIQPAHIEALRLYLMLPSCHLMEDLSMHDTIIGPFADSLKRLDTHSKKIIDTWLKRIPLTHFKRYLWIFKKCVCKLLFKLKDTYENPECETITRSLHSCIWLMDKLYTVNERRPSKASYKKFYIPQLLSTVNIHGDYIASLKDVEQDHNEFRFCKYPFLYNPAGKALLLKYQNRMTMIDADHLQSFYPVLKMSVDEKLRRSAEREFESFIPDLEIGRKTIVDDTKLQLKFSVNHLPRDEFKVKFKNEIGVGQGVNQEYFRLLFKELLSPAFGLFKNENESNLLWFTHRKELSLDHYKNYRLTGYMLGLAVYNSKLLNLPFPVALFKKLMDEDVSISFKDYEELKPGAAKIFKVDDIEELDLCFEDHLCAGGNEKKVGEENKQEFFDLTLDYQFNKEGKLGFEVFKQGFHMALDIKTLKNLKIQPAELLLIITGDKKFDVSDLKKTVTYENGYYEQHPAIRIFWKVVKELSPNEQTLFTRFITGTERMPHDGLNLRIFRFEAQPGSGEETRDLLPETQTCFHLLKLPNIHEKARAKNRLLASINAESEFNSA